MSKGTSDLTLTVKLLDKATGPLRAMTGKLNQLQKPMAGFKADWASFAKVSNLSGIADGFKRVGSEVFSLVGRVTGLGAAAAFAFWHLVKGPMEAGDKLAEMSERVGLGVDSYASLQYAARQADIDQDAFNTSMDAFVKRLGEAKAGGGSLVALLSKVAPKLAEQVKGAKSTEHGLSLMTDAFARLKDPAKRAALATAAFGKSGAQMGVFLSQGSAAIQGLQRDYLRLHGSSEALAKGAGALDNTMNDLDTAFSGVHDAIAAQLFPAVTMIAKAVTDFLVKNRDGIAKWAEKTAAAISAWVNSGGMDRLFSALTNIAMVIGDVLTFLGPTNTAFAALAILMVPLVTSIGSLVALLVAAGVSLGAIAAVAAAFVAVGAALAQVVLYWGDLKMIAREFWQEHGWWLEKLFKVGAAGMAGVKSILNPLGAAMDLGSAVGSAIVAPFTGTEQARPAAATAARNTEARVSVDFSNLPRGARVSSDPQSTAPVSLDVGYSMGATP